MQVFTEPITIIFYLSLIGIIAMIWLKSSEIRSGGVSFLSRFARRTDADFHRLYSFSRKTISYINRRSAIALVQWIAYHILSWARELYIWAHRKAHAHPPSKRVIDMVRGRGEVRKNGGVSFFLKSISSDNPEVQFKK